MTSQEALVRLEIIRDEYVASVIELYDVIGHMLEAKNGAIRREEWVDSQLPDNSPSDKEGAGGSKKFPSSDKILWKMSLVTSIIFFEEMLKKYAEVMFLRRPELLQRKDGVGDSKKDKSESKKLDYSTIIKAGSYDSLISMMIEKELYKLGMLTFDEIEAYLIAKFCLTPVSDYLKNWDSLRKAYYVRNLVVHNGGIMNKEIYDRIPVCAIGDKIDLDINYVYYGIDGVKELNLHLYDSLQSKVQQRDS